VPVIIGNKKQDFLFNLIGPDWQQKQTFLLDLIELVIIGNRHETFSLI
jgi:hypothetical protein